MARTAKPKAAWSWRDYERQHGGRSKSQAKAPASYDEPQAETALPDGAYLAPDGRLMIEVAPHCTVGEAAAARLGLLGSARRAA